MATSFHRDVTRKDGRHPYCRTCQNAKAAKWCRENRARANQNVRRYRAADPERIAKQRKDYVRKYPEKVSARAKANRAYRRGKIVKPTKCTKCKAVTTELEMHHVDYSRPLDVRWLCAPCHARVAA